MDLDEIKLYLPQYLSEDKLTELRKELRRFGSGNDSWKYFTDRLKSEPTLFQGDGTVAVVCSLPDTRIQDAPVLLLSNTCDMALENPRLNPSRIMYAPILNLEKYIERLYASGVDEERINNHITDIKNQQISQIFYLPTSVLGSEGNAVSGHDSIVFFDRTMSIALTPKNVEDMLSSRLFTLSNYGFYLLLLKLSYHFTRIQEKVDRSAI